MSADNLPTVPDALNGIPDPVSRTAWKALLHFLGGGASYLGEWIRRGSQGVADVTDGRSHVSRMLAEEVGKRAIADPVVVAAAAEIMLPGYARKLANRFAVAEQSIIELKILGTEQLADERPSGSAEDVDDDWLNNFERFAEDATSDKMRNLWGRVLAGEIRRPGSFCKATLRALYELDADVAEAFEAVRPHIILDQVLPLDDILWGGSQRAVPIKHLLTLQSAGILTGADGMIGWYFNIGEQGHGVVVVGTYTLAVFGPPSSRVQITSQALSKIGQDLAALLPNSDTLGKLKQVGMSLQNDTNNPNLTGAVVGATIINNDGGRAVDLTSGELLWGRRP